MIDKWAYFLKYASDTTPEELTNISRECPVIGYAYDVLNRCNYSKEEILEYYRYNTRADEIATSLSDAREAGLKKDRKRRVIFQAR
ncbi:MAG: hypothetical protein LBD40_03955 [Puniceicoccales bacterium]|jgi:hypothetical protein|nr:hypothetical protein [Puniceicoccales bacterium]